MKTNSNRKRAGVYSHHWCAPRGKNAKHKGATPSDPFRIGFLFNPPPFRTLRDMTEAEIVAIEREYGCPVIRPTA
jgi:hypothetical protein